LGIVGFALMRFMQPIGKPTACALAGDGALSGGRDTVRHLCLGESFGVATST
jgi:hypothetical protein